MKKYRIEAVCRMCGSFLMGTGDKPHMTRKELEEHWVGAVMSAPLNAPKCPNKDCGYSTDRDFNAGIDFLIDDGKTKVPSKKFFESN